MKYIIIIALFLFACTPQKRMQRLIKKHPELIKVDTITVKDTVITKAIQIDTSFVLINNTDTVRIEKENLKIKIFYKNDTIYLNAKCDTVYVPIEKKVIVEKINTVVKKQGIIWWNWMLIGAVVCFFLLFIILFKRR